MERCFVCRHAEAQFVCNQCRGVKYCSHRCQLEDWASDGGYHSNSFWVGCPVVGETFPSRLFPARLIGEWIDAFDAMVGDARLTEKRVATVVNAILRHISPQLPQIRVRFAERAPKGSVCRRRPFTASTDGRSWVCVHPRVRSRQFQRDTRPPAPIVLPATVSHFAVVMLHEVAHILHTHRVTQYLFMPLWRQYQAQTNRRTPTSTELRQFNELMANCFVQALLKRIE